MLIYPLRRALNSHTRSQENGDPQWESAFEVGERQHLSGGLPTASARQQPQQFPCQAPSMDVLAPGPRRYGPAYLVFLAQGSRVIHPFIPDSQQGPSRNCSLMASDF